MQSVLNMTKPGGNRAPSQSKTVLGSTQLEQLQMQDHIHITGTVCQSKNDTGADQHAIAEARRQVAYTLAALSLEERRAVLSNLYAFGDSLEVERQKLAAAMRGRFGIAGWIDDICSIWGWRFTGFSWVDLTGRWEDDLERGPDLEWIFPGDEDKSVRLVVGDEPRVFISDDSGNVWREISIDDLGDVLGEWRQGGRP